MCFWTIKDNLDKPIKYMCVYIYIYIYNLDK